MWGTAGTRAGVFGSTCPIEGQEPADLKTLSLEICVEAEVVENFLEAVINIPRLHLHASHPPPSSAFRYFVPITLVRDFRIRRPRTLLLG